MTCRLKQVIGCSQPRVYPHILQLFYCQLCYLLALCGKGSCLIHFISPLFQNRDQEKNIYNITDFRSSNSPNCHSSSIPACYCFIKMLLFPPAMLLTILSSLLILINKFFHIRPPKLLSSLNSYVLQSSYVLYYYFNISMCCLKLLNRKYFSILF